MLRNSQSRFGRVAIVLHWIIALGVIGEFALGLYMTGLPYTHSMNLTLPYVHEGVGVLLGLLIAVRIWWSFTNLRPEAGTGVSPLERLVSRVAHVSMNLLLVAIVTFGYLLSTAEGDPLSVFDWFELPAFKNPPEAQEDVAIFWHYWLAWTVIALAALHALGALKHHFIDRDQTLLRILGLDK